MTRDTYLDVVRIKNYSREAVTDSRSPHQVEAAHRESVVMAREAFSARDPLVLAAAERVLYAIHVYNGFAPPTHPVLSAIWANLTSAKLRSLLIDRVGRSSLSFDAMSDVLQSAIEDADRRDHRVLDELDDRGLLVYAKNWYTSTHGFEDQLISTMHHASIQVRQMLFANLGDELGADAVPHSEMRAQTLRNFGVNYDPDDGGVLGEGTAFGDPDVLTEAFSVANARTAFSQAPDAAYALGCFYSVEACFPAVCRRIASLLRRRGITEDALYFWALHGEADELHSAEWLDGIKRAGFSDAAHARIAQGAISHLLVRHDLFQALGSRTRLAAAVAIGTTG
jgi:hypothetical protein